MNSVSKQRSAPARRETRGDGKAPGSGRRRGQAFVTLLVVVWLVFLARGAFAESWSFAVFSDHLNQYDGYVRVLEQIQRLRGNDSTGAGPPPMEFVGVCGDLRPADKAYRLFMEMLGPRPPDYFPVRGNHERKRDVPFIQTHILPVYGDRVVRYRAGGLSYHVDVKNVRWIVLDQYADFGIHLGEPDALNWLKTALVPGPEIDHVFIAYHQPSLPWIPELDDFWTLLGEHRDRVRAVFFGHTHVYSRRFLQFGNGGIWAVNTGNSGQRSHSDGHWTLVRVTVDGKAVSFETYRTPVDTDRFEREDFWQLPDK